jgi:hypothetical protein
MEDKDKKFMPGPVEMSILLLLAKSALAGLVQAVAFCLAKKRMEKQNRDRS